MTSKDLLNLANTIQGVNLVATNLKHTKKKSNLKEITNLGVTNIIGTSMIKVNADLISSL